MPDITPIKPVGKDSRAKEIYSRRILSRIKPLDLDGLGDRIINKILGVNVADRENPIVEGGREAVRHLSTYPPRNMNSSSYWEFTETEAHYIRRTRGLMERRRGFGITVAASETLLH